MAENTGIWGSVLGGSINRATERSVIFYDQIGDRGIDFLILQRFIFDFFFPTLIFDTSRIQVPFDN